jgi:hypothetical protein
MESPFLVTWPPIHVQFRLPIGLTGKTFTVWPLIVFPHTRADKTTGCMAAVLQPMSPSAVDDLFAYAALACVLQNRKQKCKRKLWTKPWLERINNFTHTDLLQELKCFPKAWSWSTTISGHRGLRYSFQI